VIAAVFPGASAMVSAQVPSADWLPSTQRGIGFAKDPAGAVVTKVLKDSAAERAGVSEGMVITHIDGLPLRELSAMQIARLFAGARARLELKIRGVGAVVVSDAEGLRAAGPEVHLAPGGY
jgi:S1-C subfamily serine protease